MEPQAAWNTRKGLGMKFLRGLRGWRGGMIRETEGQMRPCVSRDSGMVYKRRNARNRTMCRESDKPIVPKKSGNADGGKGLAKR